MKHKALFFQLLVLIFYAFPVCAKDQPEIPQKVIEKMQLLQKGELNQLEKLKLADDLQRAGAKPEALALYEENLPMGHIRTDLPPEAYLNYGTALLEKGDEQTGLAVYEALSSTLDSKSPKTKKIREMLEQNIMNYFKVQEQKKEQEKKDKKENKDKKDEKDNKDGQQGNSGENQDKKDQQGQDKKNQNDPKDKGDKPEDKKDKKDGKGEEQDDEDKDSDKDKSEKDKKEKNESDKSGTPEKTPPTKMSPKLKQLMSDDRQLQLKVIEQGTRDMNQRQNRENKDW
jgi:hypothetical protein